MTTRERRREPSPFIFATITSCWRSKRGWARLTSGRSICADCRLRKPDTLTVSQGLAQFFCRVKNSETNSCLVHHMSGVDVPTQFNVKLTKFDEEINRSCCWRLLRVRLWLCIPSARIYDRGRFGE